MNKYPIYLGDGVYASFDGYQVWLHVGAHTNQPVVALEPEVIKALVEYNARMRAPMVSPNSLHEAACEEYLGGRKPENDDEWVLCVNYWAFNIDKAARVPATVVMAKIMDCPLPEDMVREIAEFHQ